MNRALGAFLLAVACIILGALCDGMRSVGASLISGGQL